MLAVDVGSSSLIGKTLAQYRIVEQLGAGGMGEVYRARDARLDRDVAIKVLPVGGPADDAARKRFRKEALALSRLSHANIATVFEFSTHDGVDFLVMELVEGETLAARIGGRPLPEKDVFGFGAQIAAALEEAHDNGIVHRDLKPSNILITPKGQVKVLDFGLARVARSPAKGDLTASVTATPAAAGTLPYMSPEQLQGEEADARSDIHALGAVLYEMATGQRAFREEMSTRLVDAILHRPPVAPRALNPGLSPGLERIAMKCLEKDPDFRYQSAREVAVDLRRSSSGTDFPVGVFAPRRSRFPWRVVAVGAAAIVLAAAALLVLNVGGLRDRLHGESAAFTPIRSLAVLPLENLSHDPQQDYFADGMTEELTANLAHIGALRVISRTSVMQYKGTRKTMPEIGRELNVDGLIEGSVLRAGGRVRITAQLIRAATDQHLWAQSFEGDLSDVLSLQANVARQIADEIKVALTPADQSRLTVARKVDPQAHEAYLKGSYFWNKLTEKDVKKSIEYFERAIQLAPDYAAAYASLAFSYNLLASSEYVAPQEAYPQAKKLARQASALDDNLAEAHAALGFVLCYWDWDWPGAEAEYKRAAALDPDSVHGVYALYLQNMGRSDEAIAEIKKGLARDPLSVLDQENLGWLYLTSGKLDLATEQFRKVLELAPESPDGYQGLGQAYSLQNRHDEGIAALQKAVKLSEDNAFVVAALGYAYAAAGRHGEAHRVLSDLQQMSKRKYVAAYLVATVYVGLGDKEAAFRWLAKALEERCDLLVSLKVDPLMAPLRSDSRFASLAQRVGLP